MLFINIRSVSVIWKGCNGGPAKGKTPEMNSEAKGNKISSFACAEQFLNDCCILRVEEGTILVSVFLPNQSARAKRDLDAPCRYQPPSC